MKNATILLIIDRKTDPSEVETLANSIRDQSVHLSVLVIGTMPQLPVYMYGIGEGGAYAFPDHWTEQVEYERGLMEKTAKGWAKRLAEEGIDCDVEIALSEASSLADTIARRALTCDLVVVSDALREDDGIHGDAVRAILFRSPVGVLLNSSGNARALCPERVLLAWNAGLPAARAARTALPFLRTAREVVVAIFDPVATPLRDGRNPGTDIARWLTHHGCKVDVQQLPSGGIEIGDAIRNQASTLECDLVVMGAYQRSRLREMILGGTTRTMMAQSSLAVLLAH